MYGFKFKKRKHNIKKKTNSIKYILLAFFSCVSIGYAYLNSFISINGSSSVSKNTWDIHFENCTVTEGSVTTANEVQFDNNNTTINLNVKLNVPTEFYEIQVDIANGGTIGAVLSEIIMTELTEEQQKFLSFTAFYANGNVISENDYIEAGKSSKIKIRVEYIKYPSENVPYENQQVALKLKFKYAQDDGLTKNFIERIKLNAKTDVFVDFSKEASQQNGQGVLLKSNTISDANPIYYYRGNVDNNNVRWAEKCWKIIRTTSNGGVKMIYNGSPAKNGSCKNSGINTAISTSGYKFNEIASPAGVGYMNDEQVSVSTYTPTNTYEKILDTTSIRIKYDKTTNSYNNSIALSDTIIWDENTMKYTLVSPTIEYSPIPGKFTCNSTSTECSSIAYIYHSESYIINTNDENIEEKFYHYTIEYLNNGNIIPSKYKFCTEANKDEISDCTTTYDFLYHPDKYIGKYYCIIANDDESICEDFKNFKLIKDFDYSYYYSSAIGFSIKMLKRINSTLYDFYFSKEVIYSDTDSQYSLVNPVKFDWNMEYNTNNIKNYPYTCFETEETNTCKTISYILDYTDRSKFNNYITFSKGNVMTKNLFNSMLANNKSSIVKNAIEEWYKNNLVDQSHLIEDVVYCNDRSTLSINESNILSFNVSKLNTISLSCDNARDSFSSTTPIGNGLLDYSIGLITYDEALLSGAQFSNTFLNETIDYWTMTPSNTNKIFAIKENGINSMNVSDISNIRPVITVKNELTIFGGDGSESYPYVLK